MKDTTLYEHFLGLKSPWSVKSVDLSLADQRVVVDVVLKPGLVWAAPADSTRRDSHRRTIAADLRVPHRIGLGFLSGCARCEKIPTTRELIEAGFENYLGIYNFTDEQAKALRKIKDMFVANFSSRGRVNLDTIFADPIYARLIGDFEEINRKFDGKLREVVEVCKVIFGKRRRE